MNPKWFIKVKGEKKMANEASKNDLDGFFDEIAQEKQSNDRLPALTKELKKQYGNDNKPIHRFQVKFLDNGKEIQIPDKFGTNNGKDITKRVFELEWEKNKYVLFTNKSVTSDSLYMQLVALGVKNGKNLVNVNCTLTITGKLGEKSMRYIIEDAIPTPSGVKKEVSNTIRSINNNTYNVLSLMKIMCKECSGLVTLDALNERSGLTTELFNDSMIELKEKDSIYSEIVDGVNKWGVKK